MTCCSKTKEILTTTKHIAQGFSRLARGQKSAFTDDRIRVCQKCEDNYWIGRTLWCKICKCFVPAKARVQEEKCPLDKWKE
jgi:hypothetical protein